jgi:hypothetical protein
MKTFNRMAMITAALGFLLLAGAATATTLEFSAPENWFMGADEWTVDVVVDQVDDLLGASLIIGFDPAVITPVGVGLGDLITDAGCNPFFDWVNDDDFVDTIELDTALFGCTASGGGTLVTVTFVGVASGTSALTLASADLRDSVNEPIAVETVPGSVTYLTQANATFTFQPGSVLFDEDGTTEICLYLNGVDDFLGASVSFGFNPDVIMPTGVTPGAGLLDAGCAFFLDWVNMDGFTDVMVIDTALLGCHGPFDGPLVCVALQGINYGESPLNWLQVQLRDSNNDPVPVNLVDGVVLYNAAVSTTPVNLDALKAIYR